MSHWYEIPASPATNTLFGAFFLALDRLQLVREGVSLEHVEECKRQQQEVDGSLLVGLPMVDPAAVECVLRYWMLEDSAGLCLNSLYE